MTNYSNIRYASSGTTVYADMNALIAATGSNGDQALVQSNNNIYVYSGTGWYKIATVQNDSPSAITGVAGSYELATDGTPTVITAVSTDPEGFPLTWTYSTSGLGSIATVSQSDNVFTITPSTTEADAGTFTLTINATDGVNGAVGTDTNLTLEFLVIIENSRYTTLLATAAGTSDNNNITDASTSNYTITANGDPTAGTFSPYRRGGYSYEVTATGNYIGIDSGYLTTNTTWWKTSGFTVEGWIYFTDTTNSAIFDSRTSSTNGFLFNISGQTANKISIYSAGAWRGTFSDTTFATGQWYYLALQVSGTSANLYVNGSLDSTTLTVPDTSTHSYFGQATNTLGAVQYTPRGTNSLDGFYYDWKFTAGTVYSSNFTPPTESLESDANTALYIKSDTALLRDASSNGSVVTSVGGKTSPSTPYDNRSYSADNNGGSVYFDGANLDSVKISSIASLNGGSWTVEGWYYFEADPNSTSTVFWANNSTGVLGYAFLYTEGPTPSNIAIGKRGDGAYTTAAAYDFELYKWYHIATVWNSANSTIRVYINGKQIINGTVNPVINSGNGFTLGTDGYNQKPITGYVSDFRIKTTAEYTSEFTPPTAPQSSSGTVLHLKGTDASIIDKSQGANLKLVGNTTGSTTQVKFSGSKSMYFDGTGDSIDFNTAVIPTVYNEDHTFEFWAYPTSLSRRQSPIAQYAVSQAGRMILYFDTNGSVVYYQNGLTNSGYITSSSALVSINNWYHIAVSNSSGTRSLFVDGNLIGTMSGTQDMYSGITTIGRCPSQSYDYTGYIQDLRITKGLARYTANFTPPTAPLEG